MTREAEAALLRRLASRDFNGYLARQLPHELDVIVDDVVRVYREAETTARQAILSEMTPRAASVLSVYGQRKATLAVRTGSWDALRMGLIGIGIADGVLDDYRNNLIVLAAVNHSAATVGTSLEALLQDIRGIIPSAALANFRTFADRDARDKSLRAMGLTTRGSGEDFAYVPG